MPKGLLQGFETTGAAGASGPSKQFALEFADRFIPEGLWERVLCRCVHLAATEHRNSMPPKLSRMQALLSFPFVIFLTPMTLQLLTHVQPTGYDKSGLLCQALTSTQVRLIRKERERQRRGVSSFAALPVLDAGLDPLGASSSACDSNGRGGTLNQERVWTELL